MKKPKPEPRPARPIEFTRADPKALAQFDPASKVCTANCGPHRDDPRSKAERQFLCPECVPRDSFK